MRSASGKRSDGDGDKLTKRVQLAPVSIVQDLWQRLEDYKMCIHPIADSEVSTLAWLGVERSSVYDDLMKSKGLGKDGVGIKAYCMLRGFGCAKHDVGSCAEVATKSLPSQYGHLVLGIIKYHQNKLEESILEFKKCQMGLGIWFLGSAQFCIGESKAAYQTFLKGAGMGHLMCQGELANSIREGFGCDKDAAKGDRLLQELSPKGYWKIRPFYTDFKGIEWHRSMNISAMSPGDRCFMLWPTLSCFEFCIFIVLSHRQVVLANKDL